MTAIHLPSLPPPSLPPFLCFLVGGQFEELTQLMRDCWTKGGQILSRTIPRVSMGMNDGVSLLEGYVRDVRNKGVTVGMEL